MNARVENVDALYGLLEGVTTSNPTAEWMRVCDEHSISAAPVVDLVDIADDPHFDAVGLIEHHQHPTEGPYRVVRSPIKFRSGDPGLFQPVANLGEHNAEVLAEIGYDQAAIDAATPETPPRRCQG